MANVLDCCIRLADASLDRSAVDLDLRSKTCVLGDREEPHRASNFSQRILLPSKGRVGAREQAQLTSAAFTSKAQVLLDFRFEQRKRRFVLCYCPGSVAEHLVNDRVQKCLWADGIEGGDRFEFDGIEKGQRLARIVHHEADPNLRLPPLEPAPGRAKHVLGQVSLSL